MMIEIMVMVRESHTVVALDLKGSGRLMQIQSSIASLIRSKFSKEYLDALRLQLELCCSRFYLTRKNG
jgi:hypothetical protein